MDTFLVITGIIRANSSLHVLKAPECFLNVDEEELFWLFYAIQLAKCLICGFCEKKFPNYLNIVMLSVNLLIVLNNANLGKIDIIILTYFFATICCDICHLDHWRVLLLIICWILFKFEKLFQFLLDVYTTLTILMYFFKFYGRETEKAMTFLCLPICLCCYIDTYHANHPLTVFEPAIAFSSLFIMLLQLRPSRGNTWQFYSIMCASMWVWLFHKYCTIVVAQGISIYPLDIPDGKYGPLRTVANYLDDTFGLSIPSIKLTAEESSILVNGIPIMSSSWANQDETILIINPRKTLELVAM